MNQVKWCTPAAALVMLIHVSLIGWVGANISPVRDEVAHLAAGLYTWRFFRFDVYRVNPPLVRSIAALPVAVADPLENWNGYVDSPGDRPEWELGKNFVATNGALSFWYFTIARWTCVPILVLGGWVCWRWSSEIYGATSGYVALMLWCFSPNVIAWSSTICPDVHGAALGVAACYLFKRWLEERCWSWVVGTGISLGLAQLSKTTWVVLAPTWLMLWCICAYTRTDGGPRLGRGMLQMGAVLSLALFTINAGYGFEGTFRRLDEFTFVSRTLAASDSVTDVQQGGNRFATTSIGSVRIPLPENYVTGIDLQRHDFEKGKWCYLFGEWKFRGWWYYYLVCAALKVPLGTWLLGAMAFGLAVRDCSPVFRTRIAYFDQIVVLAPAIAVFLLVSSQTGFTIYFRYVILCFPFVIIWISRIGTILSGRKRWCRVACVALVWSMSSSLWNYPHSMSYFNELTGGPKNGHQYLIHANVDWGQDMFYLKRWCERHPYARPLKIAHRSIVDLKYLGFDRAAEAPHQHDPPFIELRSASEMTLREPGWYALSVHHLRSRDKRFGHFLHVRPTARVGNSLHIYHILRDTPGHAIDSK